MPGRIPHGGIDSEVGVTLPRRVRSFIKENTALIAVLAIIVLAYALLQTSPDVTTQEELDAVLAGGRPVLLELYSNT